MENFKLIPKLLPRRNRSDYIQKIPMVIWQTMKTNRVPVFMKDYADTWIDLNPEYEYRFFDDNDIIEFISSDFPEYLEGYYKLEYGASKADLWRYLIIYKYGGVYADLDCRCLRPLREWIQNKATFVTQLGTNKDICQWLIISVPNNPIFLKAAEKTLENSNTKKYKTFYHGFGFTENKLYILQNETIKSTHPVLSLSGPPVLQEAAEKCLRENLLSDFLPYLQIVCVSSLTISCQMNNYVAHETGNEEYLKSFKKLKLIHYNSRYEKLKRKIISALSFHYYFKK
jgi:mannosyltransferase OCH1-like enzyme